MEISMEYLQMCKKADEAIRAFYRSNLGDMPDYVLMHPETAKKFGLLCSSTMVMHAKDVKTMKYRGMKIIRSEDIKPGKFEAVKK